MNMNFTPDKDRMNDVPFFEDVIGDEGWQGHRTEKTIDKLKQEVADAVGRLGGFVRNYQSGTFTIGKVARAGLQLHYTINGAPARLDIAALPCRNDTPGNRNKALKMALFMLRDAFDGLWFLQQLSPGYAALMPFMIADNKGRTVSQLWADSQMMNKILPPPDADFEVIDA